MKAKGRTPNGKWKTVELGEIFDIARGGSPRPIDKFITDDPNGTNWIMISDATSKYITSTKKRIIKEGAMKSREVQPGDFLLTNSMSFGRPYIMQTSGCIHDGWLVLSPRVGVAHPDYFYHLLGSDVLYAEFERRAAGATVKNLNINLVKGVEVLLPPISEQRRIAEVLDRAESLWAKRRAALAQIDSLTQSIFLDLFDDPDTNLKRWPMRAVSDYVRELQGGKSIDSESGENVVTRNRILKVSAVTGMKFLAHESKPVPDSYQPPPQHFAKPGDLLFSRANTTELVGAVAYVETTPPNVLLPDKLWRFVWKDSSIIEPIFVWALFQTAALRREIGRRATGTSGSMKNISQEKVFGIRTILPPYLPAARIRPPRHRRGKTEGGAARLAGRVGRALRLPPAPRLPRRALKYHGFHLLKVLTIQSYFVIKTYL